MWAILAMAGLAAAEAPPVGVEGGLALAMPHAGLGPAPGLRLLVDVQVADAVWVGGEGDARFPGAARFELSGDGLANDVELRTAQTALSLGARAAWTPGDADGLRWRVGGALGATRLLQKVEGDAGKTVEGAASVWIRPEGGIVYALGPGFLTAGLYWSISPTQLDLLGGAGNVLGVVVGWRMEFGGGGGD